MTPLSVMLVSQYFPPEPGATQNRMMSFCEGLMAHGHDVSVVCEQPNHPAGVFHAGFGHRPLVTEQLERGRVRRVWVATSTDKTTASRLAFYATFAAGAGLVTALARRPDVVFASSPPLPGAFAACSAAWTRRIPFVLDVRDLWPAAAEALGELREGRVLHMFERVERWLYRHAAAVTATTTPFCRHIDRVAGAACSVHLPNGALDELIALPPTQSPGGDEFVAGYVGNLGIAQGLDALVDAAEELRDEPIRIRIVGDGPRRAELEAERNRRGLDRLELQGSVSVADVAKVLQGCDALIVPLRAHAVLEDFIPSKLFDAMAVGRPVVLAARGESERLLEETGSGLAVPPEDGRALAGALRTLNADRALAARMGAAGREAVPRFARSRQVARLERVLQLAAARAPIEVAA